MCSKIRSTSGASAGSSLRIFRYFFIHSADSRARSRESSPASRRPLKTLLMSAEPIRRVHCPELVVIVGRFSGDNHWPVLGDYRGLEDQNQRTIRKLRLGAFRAGRIISSLVILFMA